MFLTVTDPEKVKAYIEFVGSYSVRMDVDGTVRMLTEALARVDADKLTSRDNARE